MSDQGLLQKVQKLEEAVMVLLESSGAHHKAIELIMSLLDGDKETSKEEGK